MAVKSQTLSWVPLRVMVAQFCRLPNESSRTIKGTKQSWWVKRVDVCENQCGVSFKQNLTGIKETPHIDFLTGRRVRRWRHSSSLESKEVWPRNDTVQKPEGPGRTEQVPGSRCLSARCSNLSFKLCLLPNITTAHREHRSFPFLWW